LSRKWKTKQSRLVLDKVTNTYKYVQIEKEQKYRGNYLSYAFRASEIMQEPAIKRQVRRHWRILRDVIKKRVLA
jgi:adenylate cyclase class IV